MKIFKIAILIAALAVAANAQVKHTENTVKLPEGQASEKASLADMAWLAGSWTGTGFGGVNEELWSKPNGGAMVGTYRLIKDGKAVFYEMMMLVEREDSIVLRLKHFNPDFTGWEEKDKSVDFKFVNKAGSRMNFSGLTFDKVSGDKLNIYLALKQKDGSVKEEVFSMTRMK